MSLSRSIPWAPSPHFSSRRQKEPEALIIHYTAGGRASGTVAWFANPISGVSAHFVIGRNGLIVQTVDLGCVAYHAGLSEMTLRGESCSGVNGFSIGIELANRGWLHEDEAGNFWYSSRKEMKPYRGIDPIEATLSFDFGLDVEGWWEPYPEIQIDALDLLIKMLADNGYRKAVSRIRGHESVAMPMGRKIDPGPLFPWERFGGWDNQRTEGHRS